MKNIKLDKVIENLKPIFIVFTTLGLISLFMVQISFTISVSFFVYISWILLSTLLYGLIDHLKPQNNNQFDFYKVAEPVGRQSRRKKQNIEERIAIHIDEDGLDPMVLFNEEKSGVACILKLTDLNLTSKLPNCFSQLAITTKQQGQPIAGQILMEMNFKDQHGYYRLTIDGEQEIVEFAFLENSELLYEQVSQAIRLLLEQSPQVLVTKIDVTNFQAMRKFYNYVQRLNAPENRSIEYLSYCQGTLKICNSSYVELYDCTLQSTLTSWVNQDGLIRTDNVEVDLGNDHLLHLMDIELPYPMCRLINIQIVKVENPEVTVKLYLTLAELNNGQLTENRSGLTLLMKDSSISIKREEQGAELLISVAEYFEQKSYPKF